MMTAHNAAVSQLWIDDELLFGRFTGVAFYQAGNCGDDDP
jgi:hypothetical protein